MPEVCSQRPIDPRLGHSRRKQSLTRPLQSERAVLPKPYFALANSPSWYQNPVENAYRLLPRPPQPQAAHFKRLYRN
jgi:hypothetical protein